MRSTLVLLLCFAVFCAGVVAASAWEDDGPGYPGDGHHPPGVGNHPPGEGRHGPAWSKWRAYRALQAWKKGITEDPEGILESWVGPDVCRYKGVFCSPPEDPELADLEVVAGIDLNHADLKGCLVPELGLLREISLFHLNSNRFSGTVPESFKYMKTLFELDLSNNEFSGTFPEAVLAIPKLGFLDLRFNRFQGKLPRALFAKRLDAIFLNNNRFDGELPDSFGQSGSSAIVIANNNLHGSIPHSISNLKGTLNEIVVLNNNFHGSLPSSIGQLHNVTLFDCSDNRVEGGIPSSIKNMAALETIGLGKNRLSGPVTAQLCSLDHLSAVILDDNYFNAVNPSCSPLGDILSLKGNCLPDFSDQKSNATCAAFYPRSPSPPPPPPPPACPEGYTLGRSSKTCFKLVSRPKKWDEAEFACRRHSRGHLAAVADWDELKDVARLCSSVNETRFASRGNPRGLGCYLGGRKPKLPPPTKGWSFPWSPCVAFNQSLWNDGEPNNRGGCETCLSVKYESEDQERNPNKLPYMFNDLSCDVPLPFICALPRCRETGCKLPQTCKSFGDEDARCASDSREAVGFKCDCSEGFRTDSAGTCIGRREN